MSGSLFNFLIATDSAASQAKTNKALVKKRDAKNERSASESELQRFNQSLTNKKIMDRAGKNYGVLSENLNRRLDAFTLNDTMGRLAVSEELGAVAAAAAAAGVGGSSVERYNQTVRTAEGLQRERAARGLATDKYNTMEAMGSVITDAVDSFDRNIYRANIDYTYYGPTKGPSVLGNLVTLGAAAAATALGAPQVGEAILDMKTANMQGSYGDAAGAAKSLDRGLGNLKAGIGQVRDSFRFKPSSGGGSDISFSNQGSYGGFSGAQSQFGSDGINLNSISFR